MANASKQKGTKWERQVVDYLNDALPVTVERRALEGTKDRGDVSGLEGVCINRERGTTSVREGDGMRPRLLDLFCGAGGAAMGYARAGFDVVGVDIVDQPSYPFDFVEPDALEFPLEWFDAIHASPPCKAHTTAGAAWKNKLGTAAERWPDLIGPTRERLQAAECPWVMENVPGSPLRNSFVLCGSMFGLNVKRHRWFESNQLILAPSCGSHDYDYVICFGGGVRGRAHQIGRTANNSGPILRRSSLALDVGQQAMGIDWMDRHELSQAIPPAYTQHIGEQLLAHLEVAA